MKHIKLTLAITLTALAFLCACDNSSSANDETPANEVTPTQTQPNVFTKTEQYSYMFYNFDECGAIPAIIDAQFTFGPGDAIKMTITEPGKTTIESGMYRDATTDKGEHYYLIQTNQFEGTYNYFPDEELIITAKNIVVAAFFKDANLANAVAADICSK